MCPTCPSKACFLHSALTLSHYNLCMPLRAVFFHNLVEVERLHEHTFVPQHTPHTDTQKLTLINIDVVKTQTCTCTCTSRSQHLIFRETWLIQCSLFSSYLHKNYKWSYISKARDVLGGVSLSVCPFMRMFWQKNQHKYPLGCTILISGCGKTQLGYKKRTNPKAKPSLGSMTLYWDIKTTVGQFWYSTQNPDSCCLRFVAMLLLLWNELLLIKARALF